VEQQLLDLIGLTEFPVGRVACATCPDRSGTRSRVQPITGTRIAKDAPTQATVMAPYKQRKMRGAILALVN